MSEEIVVETVAPNEGTPINTVEDQAREQGWVPKDEFSGDEHKWVEAGEFIRRGELFKKIEQVSRTAKEAKQTLEQFKSHYLKMQEIANKNAIEQLRKERKLARDDGDFDKVDAIEDQIEEVKANADASKREIMATTTVPEVYPEVAAWVDKNSWYNSDMPMKAYADTVALELNKRGITGSELLKGIDAKIREAFPQKFSNPNRQRPGAVESSTTSSTSSRGDTLSWMTEQDKQVMHSLTKGKDPAMTKEEYIADLKKVRGIK